MFIPRQQNTEKNNNIKISKKVKKFGEVQIAYLETMIFT
jgi:hypothetical protein